MRRFRATADLSLITEKEGLFMPNMKLTTYNSRRLARSAFVLVLDALWIAAAFYLALWVRFEFGVIPVRFTSVYGSVIGWWCLISVIVLALTGSYNCIWRYVGLRDLQRLLVGHGILLGLGLFLSIMLDWICPALSTVWASCWPSSVPALCMSPTACSSSRVSSCARVPIGLPSG